MRKLIILGIILLSVTLSAGTLNTKFEGYINTYRNIEQYARLNIALLQQFSNDIDSTGKINAGGVYPTMVDTVNATKELLKRIKVNDDSLRACIGRLSK